MGRRLQEHAWSFTITKFVTIQYYYENKPGKVLNGGNFGHFGHSIGNDVQYDVGYSASFLSECPELPPFYLS